LHCIAARKNIIAAQFMTYGDLTTSSNGKKE